MVWFLGLLACFQPAPPEVHPTRQLVSDEEVAILVDRLASAAGVQSSHVGAAGQPSEVWATAVAVGSQATVDQRITLLNHESPVVRVYMAGTLCAEASASDALRALEADLSEVGVTDGCDISQSTVGQEVASKRWCSAALTGVGK